MSEERKSNYDYSKVEPPRVTWTVGYKVNVGNFETLNLQSSVEDVKRPNETLEQANQRIFNFVNEEIEEKVKIAKRTFNVQ